MRIVDLFIVFFSTSMIMLNVHGKPAGDIRGFLLPDNKIRMSKRNEDSSNVYLEQCGIVKFSNVQRGVVNVLAFLDSSWPYSHRQAIMLKMLNERLTRSGLPDTVFFVINVDPYFSGRIDTTEDDIEREAWLGVSPDEIEKFSEINKTFDSLAMSMNPDIRVIQDNEDLGIWRDLRGSRDQVLVIDRCGKLTYQVIVPWSILHFPYVKAAILSTYKDEPCGPCDVIKNATDDSEPNDLEVSLETTNSINNDKIIVTLTTGSYGRTKETIDKQTLNQSEDKTNMELNTSEATLTSTFFLSPVMTTLSEATAPVNLITEDDYNTMKSGTKKYEESILRTFPIDFSTDENNLREIEDDFTTISSTAINDDFTIDIADSTTDYKDVVVDKIEEIAEMIKLNTSLEGQTKNFVGLKEITIDLESKKNLLSQKDKDNTTVVDFNTTDIIALDNTSTEENLSVQTTKYLDLEATSINLENEKISLDQKDKNKTFYNDFIERQVTDSSNRFSVTSHGDKAINISKIVDAASTEEMLDLKAQEVFRLNEKSLNFNNNENSPHDKEKDKGITISSNYSSVTRPMDTIDSYANGSTMTNIHTLDSPADTAIDEVLDFPVTKPFHFETEFAVSKMENLSIIPVTDSINFDLKDTNFVTTNEYQSTSPIAIDSAVDKTTKVISNTTQTRHFMDAIVPSKMVGASLDSIAESIGFDDQDTNFVTTNNYDSTNVNTIDNVVDKTGRVISNTSTAQALQYEDKMTSEMEVTSLDSITNSIESDAEDIPFGPTNDYEATSPDTIDNIVRTTTNDISNANTPKVSTINEKPLIIDDSRIIQDLPDDSEESEEYSTPSYMPIRIIMHAPHFHADRDSTRMHEYLVLRTGHSKNHGHLASNDATRLYHGPQDYQEKNANLTGEEIERKEWSMKNLIYNRDESTGLFGEVADYWRDLAVLENYEDVDDTATTDDEQIDAEAAADEKLWKEPTEVNNQKFPSVDKTVIDSETTTEGLRITSEIVTEMQSIQGTEEFNSAEEETRSKLIAHYSKLLPWIYYVLEKKN